MIKLAYLPLTLKFKAEDRQFPAVGVWPVFIPELKL
jgi:hypothetical protein